MHLIFTFMHSIFLIHNSTRTKEILIKYIHTYIHSNLIIQPFGFRTPLNHLNIWLVFNSDHLCIWEHFASQSISFPTFIFILLHKFKNYFYRIVRDNCCTLSCCTSLKMATSKQDSSAGSVLASYFDWVWSWGRQFSD